jgi:hypothetical protein
MHKRSLFYIKRPGYRISDTTENTVTPAPVGFRTLSYRYISQ